jgi:nitrogen fixation NifU-like protein
MHSYSPQIIEHFTNPRNLGALADADVSAEAANPCCGDRIRLYARVRGQRIAACTFLAHGCAASIALGSLLTQAVVGKEINELTALGEDRLVELGGLRPSQRHCAALASDALVALTRNYRTFRPKGVHS